MRRAETDPWFRRKSENTEALGQSRHPDPGQVRSSFGERVAEQSVIKNEREVYDSKEVV